MLVSGLGGSIFSPDFSGMNAWCSSPGVLLTPGTCTDYANQQFYGIDYPSYNVAAPTVPAGALTAPYAPTEADVQAVINSPVLGTQQNITDYLAHIPNPTAPPNWIWLAGIAAVAFLIAKR